MQGKTVAVADTEVETRRRLVHAIEHMPGFSVVGETNDGEQLLKMCTRTKCDIIVMDLILCTVDGLEVLDRLRTMRRKPLVIVLSSFAVEQVAKLSIARGADYVMLKPYKVECVVKRICQMAQPTASAELTDTFAPELKMAVTSILHELGIPSHIKGYRYLREAVMLAVEDGQNLECITKLLYPQIAKKYATTVYGVERAIRHAIEITWERGERDTLRRFFGYALTEKRGKPTNSVFIAQMVQWVSLRLSDSTVYRRAQ